MNKHYFACLKLKSNEIDAIKDLDLNLLENVTPLFDIPRNLKDTNNIDSAYKYITNGIKKLDKWWDKGKQLILDCYDLPTLLDQNNLNIYSDLLNTFLLSGYKVVPVLALNRDKSHNNSVINLAKTNFFETVALRLDHDDIDDFSLCKKEIESLINSLPLSKFIIILDIRLIKDNSELKKSMSACMDFLDDLSSHPTIKNYNTAITSSSIKSYIAKPNTTPQIPRYESNIYTHLISKHPELNYGDYGIIGPDYSDEVIPDYLMPDVSTPKLIYTEEKLFHIFKGGSFKRSDRHYNQFHDLALKVVNLNCYRNQSYSKGDAFIDQKSITDNQPSSQGHWYKHLNNAHMTYILCDFL